MIKFIQNKIVMVLLTLSLAFSVIGRKLAGKENEDREYLVKFFGYQEWNC